MPAANLVHRPQEEAIGDKFFAALERVREIHANCRALLRTHHQRAGLELMDAMAAHQEAAYERLCRCPRQRDPITVLAAAATRHWKCISQATRVCDQRQLCLVVPC